MKGYILTICLAMTGTIAMAYNQLEYKGQARVHGCTGECYAEYVALNGTPAEIERRKQALAQADEFSSIRSLWAGCAACHGKLTVAEVLDQCLLVKVQTILLTS